MSILRVFARRRLVLSALFALVIAAVVGGAWAQGQPTPKSVTIGTNPAGTVFFALASGIAKVVSGGAGYQMVVQPHAGTSTMLPLINSGELEFGVQNAVDLWLAYRGPSQQIGGRNPFAHSPNIRLVMRGAPLMVGLLVRKDSPIKTVHDVKGKRFTGEYRAHLAVWYNMFGHLSSAGLGWNDVKVVPVNTVNDGVDALVQGRADVTQHTSPTTARRRARRECGRRCRATIRAW
jgi:TRAP transporter TAXI family solute receptor